MTIPGLVQHHRPMPWEGGCAECTAAYRRDPGWYLDRACMSGKMIDTWLREHFLKVHAVHMVAG